MTNMHADPTVLLEAFNPRDVQRDKLKQKG
jgi:hypothetical protein